MKLTGVIECVFHGVYIFRGYATLKNLVTYSYPNYQYQRPTNKNRINSIVDFYKSDNPYEFFPELIFGLQFKDEKFIEYIRKRTIPGGIKLEDNIRLSKSNFLFDDHFEENPTSKTITLDFGEDSTQMTRIDGNHRLSAAEQLFSDTTNSEEMVRLQEKVAKMVVPYSILLQISGKEADSYESAFFYLINAKSRPLTQEENLKSILSNGWFSVTHLNEFFSIPNAEAVLSAIEILSKMSFPSLQKILDNDFYSCIYKVFRLGNKFPKRSLEVGNLTSAFQQVNNDFQDDEVLKNCSSVDIVCALLCYYCWDKSRYPILLTWIKSNNVFLAEGIIADTVVELFEKTVNHEIKIFAAMPYFGKEEVRSINAIFKRVVFGIRNKYSIDIIMLGDVMTYEGHSINIINDVMDRVKHCDICVCDITGNNPNVTYEMGIARALGKKMILLREEGAERPRSDYQFDYYDTYKKDAYITYEECIEKNLKAILRKDYGFPINM